MLTTSLTRQYELGKRFLCRRQHKIESFASNTSAEIRNFDKRCEGISGTIGDLRVRDIETSEPVVFPINALVLDLTKEDAEDVENGDMAIVDG